MFLFLFLVFFFFYLYTMNKRYIHIHAWQLLNKIIKILKSGSTKTTGTNYCICWSCFQSHSPPSLLFFFFFSKKIIPTVLALGFFQREKHLIVSRNTFYFCFSFVTASLFPTHHRFLSLPRKLSKPLISLLTIPVMIFYFSRRNTFYQIQLCIFISFSVSLRFVIADILLLLRIGSMLYFVSINIKHKTSCDVVINSSCLFFFCTFLVLEDHLMSLS